MMISRNIASTEDSQSSANQSAKREPIKELGKDDFLELLTVQLKYQDPMSPVKDQDFIAQMAQFSSLEQIQNLTGAMNNFTDSTVRLNMMSQASGFIGREVEVTDSESGKVVAGKVSRITFIDGVPQLHIGDGVYSLWSVSALKG